MNQLSIFLALPDKHDWEWHNDNDRMLSVGLIQPDWTRSINKDVSLDTRGDAFFLCISFCFLNCTALHRTSVCTSGQVWPTPPKTCVTPGHPTLLGTNQQQTASHKSYGPFGSLRDHCASYAIRQDYCANRALPLIFLMLGIAGVHRINIITQGVIGVHRHSFWPTQISENSSPVQSVCVFEYAIVNRDVIRYRNNEQN